MRLANRVLFCALAIFVLSVVAVAQTPRGETDPRNLSPSVGTGGPEGGPTGLFTIYDGQTLRKGEFTFSFAYSNFDRDPGNVDITEIPLSVNVGINDHLEIFFKTTGYRGVKVNNPQDLSGFYLPNSRVFFSTTLTGSPPAIIIAPTGPNVGTLAGTAVFRPAFCPACTTATGGATFVYFNGGQPFVAYPFNGGPGPNFGLGPGGLGTLFGFPGFNAQLYTTPIGGSGNYGAAAAFPGVGSPAGSILPGIVLATGTLPTTALTMPITVPVVYTTTPSYLPDAPFINRLYGESTFNTFSGGVKWRITSPRNPIGVALIPMYRFYADHGGDASGFNMLQRGASPGGSLGDFGLTLAVDGRLTRKINVSANLGYWLNSNPKDPAGFALLDRPDEFIAGIGLDFPINKKFQPIAELRSTYYMGGHTPNAMNNNPVEVLAGAKIYPARWWGIGVWIRRHLNQQSAGNFNGVTFAENIQQITNVNVPGRGLVVVPGTTLPSTANGLPLGFTPSSDPWGYGAQVWFGHRNKREPAILPNQAPTAAVATSTETLTLPCPADQHSDTCQPSAMNVQVTTTASDPDGDTLLYSYTVTGGRITGEGANVSWDLSGVSAGTYTVTVDVDDGCGCITSASHTVTVSACTNCVENRPAQPVCPTSVNVDCPSGLIQPGTPVTFSARVDGGPGNQTYNWTVSAGTISSGQGTSSITVDTTGLAGQSITATVELGGLDPTCNRTASCTATVVAPPVNRKFDEYGNIRFNDEKARLDNFAVQLQNEPSATGYIIGYGNCDAQGMTRANRAKDYLVNTRGIDASRITTVDGGCLPDLQVQLWISPQGAAAPTGDATGVISPCPDCKKPAARKRTRRRGEE